MPEPGSRKAAPQQDGPGSLRPRARCEAFVPESIYQKMYFSEIARFRKKSTSQSWPLSENCGPR